MDGGASYNSRTVEEVFRDFKGRRAGMIKALASDVEELYQQCDPVDERNCLDASTSKDSSFYHFVKPPANLIVLEGDCLDTTDDAGELVLPVSNIAKSVEAAFTRWAVKRVRKFLLKKKLGKFILGDIAFDQLDVQLRQGIFHLSDLALNVRYLNHTLARLSPVDMKAVNNII